MTQSFFDQPSRSIDENMQKETEGLKFQVQNTS